MSTQLNALLAALSSGAQEIYGAILKEAQYYEQHMDEYNPYELLGFEHLQNTKNTDIKHYLYLVAELGTDGTDDQLWGAISIAVLTDEDCAPGILNSQIAIQKESIDNE